MSLPLSETEKECRRTEDYNRQTAVRTGLSAVEQSNFHNYRIIRHNEAPKQIEVHFIENDIDPTGLGEPPFPPVFGAVANALYKNKGKRFYNQPFQPELEKRI